jgi:hypothetical protein
LGSRGRGISFRDQPKQKNELSSQKQTKSKWPGVVTQVLKHLLSKYEAKFNSQYRRKKKRKEGGTFYVDLLLCTPLLAGKVIDNNWY